MRGRDRLDGRRRDDEHEDRGEVGECRLPSDAGPQGQPAHRGEGGGQPFERQLRQVGEEAIVPAAECESYAQRVGAEHAADHEIAEPTRATVVLEAEEGEQKRRGQDAGVGERD